jgi:hypothetical protein
MRMTDVVRIFKRDVFEDATNINASMEDIQLGNLLVNHSFSAWRRELRSSVGRMLNPDFPDFKSLANLFHQTRYDTQFTVLLVTNRIPSLNCGGGSALWI